ncbi:hypothetical protein ABZS88_33830 [Streptomyces sp. NPDC005480]|jgi:hypothetical protein|uniref:hypothetical protein n=1 Tax=Streptomyces sp. NPDC005480 TaxID=3154880 RepID=UPI0033B7AF3D
MLRRGLKLTALAAVVVLALTGFSTGRGHGSGKSKSRGSSSHSSSGGGCSSSKQNHSGSSSSTTGGSSADDDDDSYGSSSSGSSGYTSGGSSYNRRPTRTPSTSSTSGSGRSADITAKVLRCAGKNSAYASVELRNRGSRDGRYNLTVHFQDASDITVIDGSTTVTVPANGTKVAKVKPGGGADLLQSIDHCRLDGAQAPS